jgi:hypothetical protein
MSQEERETRTPGKVRILQQGDVPKLLPSPHSSHTGDDQVFPNPTYGHTPTVPFIQYSALGPRGTPNDSIPTHAYDVIGMNPAPSQPQRDERVYHVLEGPQKEARGENEEEEEERKCHLLGEVGTGNAYEVLTSTSTAPAVQQVDEPLDTGYSRLQH